MLTINAFVILVVGYLYFKEQYYLAENDKYVWAVVFFASQLIGFLIVDSIVLLFLALIVSKCCTRCKILSAVFYKESLYIYEDFKYVSEFSRVQEFTPYE